MRKKRLIFTVFIMTAVIGLTGVFFLNVENSFINYFRKSTTVYQGLAFIDQSLGGSIPLDVVYDLPEAQDREKRDIILTSEETIQISKIHHILEKYEATGKVFSVFLLLELAKQINEKPLTEYELTALYWSLPQKTKKDFVSSVFSPKHNQVRFNVRIKDTMKGLDRSRLLNNIHDDLIEEGIEENRFIMTNLFILYNDILQRLFRSQILTIGIVAWALFLTFLILFRSLKVALIALVPNIFSILFILGFMGWMRIPLDLMTITIASITMGIAVDDTIHYIHHYLKSLKAGHDPLEAMDDTQTTVGYAMLYTSLVIIIGFSILIVSDFIPSIYFGLLTGLAMFTALVSALTLLPLLLRKFVVKSPG